MDLRLEMTLIECLSLLDSGESVDAVLARYPAEAEQLRPLLEVATALPALSMAPSQPAQTASRRAFLNQAHEIGPATRPQRFWLPARLAIGLAVLVVAFLSIGGTVAASGAALPGEPLYTVKRAVEDARMLIAPQSDQPELAEQFQQRRRDEIARLLSERRAASVSFDGTIDAMQSGQWTIGGLPVQVDQATGLFGTPGLRAEAHVQGHTDNGRLFASQIQITPGTGVPPTVTPSPTPQPTATTAPTRTPQPTATTPPTATTLPTSTATPRPSATATRQPAAVPTATTPPPPAAPAPTTGPPPAAPTAEHEPEVEVELSGSVENIGGIWRVGGIPIEVDGATEIRDTINVGDTVRVRAVRLADGRLVARRIERRDGSQNSGGGSNSGSGGGGGDDNGGGGSGSNSGSGSGDGSNSGSSGSGSNSGSDGSNSGSGGSSDGGGSDGSSGGHSGDG